MQNGVFQNSTRYIHFDDDDELTPGRLSAFILSCAAILFAYNPTLGSTLSPVGLVAWIFVLFSAFALRKERQKRKVWLAWVMSTVTTAAATLWINFAASSPASVVALTDYRPATILAGLILLTTIAALSAFRFSPVAYLGLAAAMGLEAMIASGSLVVGIAVAGIYSLLLVFLNYLVKLFIDHHRDVRLLMRAQRGKIRFTDIFGIFKYAFGPIAFIAALVGIGVISHDYLQGSLKGYVYENNVLPRSQEGLQDKDRDLRIDSYAAIDQRSSAILYDFKQTVSSKATAGKIAVDDVSSMLRDIVSKHGLAPANSSSCDSLYIQPPRIFGIRIGGGIGAFADMCRSAAASFYSSLQATFKAATDKLLENTDGVLANAKTSIQLSEERAIEYGERSIAEAQLAARTTVDGIFSIVDALYVIGWVVLTSAIVGATALVLARRLFSPEGQVPFSLGLEGGSTKLELAQLERSQSGASMVRIGLLHAPAGTRYWYVTTHDRLVREGDGWEGPAIPQPFSCFLQRIPRRWALQRINIDVAAKAERGGYGARFGTGEKSRYGLACIRVQPGQQLVFKVKHLIAFSDGVSLRSSYSTHVGLHLLGLGAFQTYVEGDGWLVLGLNEGTFRPSVRGKDRIYPPGVVCWDRRARFLVSHTSEAERHWFSESQVVPQSKDGSVLIGEYGCPSTGIIAYLRRLAGYLVLPY